MADQYIQSGASGSQKEIAEAKTEIQSTRTALLRVALKPLGEPPEEYKKSGKEKT
jgi:hypothetical protein